MGAFRYIPPDEVAERHRAAHPAALSRQVVPTSTPQERNVEHVLTLGEMRYVSYRNRTFRIRPVPFKLGERVLDLKIKILADAKQVAKTGARAPAEAFYDKLDQMAKLLWMHMQPIGKVRRLMWHLGMLRNPFRNATETELIAIVDFFLQGRMMSSVRSMSEKEALL